MGEAPSLRAWGGSQTYMLFIPGSVAPANLRAFKGFQGTRHITRGNKNLWHLGPRFSSVLIKPAGSPTPSKWAQGWDSFPWSACRTFIVTFSGSDIR